MITIVPAVRRSRLGQFDEVRAAPRRRFSQRPPRVLERATLSPDAAALAVAAHGLTDERRASGRIAVLELHALRLRAQRSQGRLRVAAQRPKQAQGNGQLRYIARAHLAASLLRYSTQARLIAPGLKTMPMASLAHWLPVQPIGHWFRTAPSRRRSESRVIGFLMVTRRAQVVPAFGVAVDPSPMTPDSC